MSYAREIGFAIQQASKYHKEELCNTLGITPQELKKLYRGRLFLTGSELEKVAEVCGVSAESLVEAEPAQYDAQVVDCMSDFDDRENREMILDLIDAYIDAKEALARDKKQ